MKKIVLFLSFLLLLLHNYKGQVEFNIISNNCDTNTVGAINFEYAGGTIDGSSVDWNCPSLYDTFVKGCLVLVNDGTSGTDIYGNPQSQHGCSPILNDLFGKIAVINRGTCEFSLKAFNAQQRGAIAVIIINHTGDAVPMSGGGFGTQINIPVIMIGETDGNNLVLCLDTVCTGVIGSIGRVSILGKIFTDPNTTCTQDSNEVGVPSWLATIMPGNIIVQTNNEGYWSSNPLPAGNYTITIDTSSYWQATCPVSQNFTVTHPDSLVPFLNFGIRSNLPCAISNISINMPFIRNCRNNQFIYIEACNTFLGTGILNNSYAIINLDSLITPTSSSIPFISLGNQSYQFDIGDLSPGQCVDFWIKADVSCDAIIGQTLCMKANLYPADSCIFDTLPTPPIGGVQPCTLPWDHSSLTVEGWCANDSVNFSVTNTGDLGNGNMQCYSPVFIYIDGVLTYLDSVLLQGGETTIFSYPANGQTWILQTEQHPLHPGNSHPNAHVELCGDTINWTQNMINIIPQDDAEPFVDIYCNQVITSYDPNDKTGYPLGVGSQHFIAPNGDIEYVIRFQNTGTDTAFTVTIRDTLATDLDIFSVVSGVSSHNYTFQMYGPRVLEWTFSNILLPDSTTDEQNSHGFVTFSVDQNPELPNGTEINNSVGIYFDFNEPIITNTTSHIVNREIYYLVSVNEIKAENGKSLSIYPNPTKNSLNVILPNSQKLSLVIYSIDGKLIENRTILKNTTIDVSAYQSGMYFIKATNEEGNIYQSKFIKE